jgi:predicted amidophosphoribosyltransferase
MAIKRVKVTRQQIGLGRDERRDNVRAAFRVPPEHDITVRGRRVLLVDDVYTTGATVASATKALKRSGASAVDILTFARVLRGDPGTEDFGTRDFRPGEPGPI